MPRLAKTEKGLTVVIQYDKDSHWYIDESGNPVSDLDEYRLNRMLSNLKGRKGTFTETYQAVSQNALNKHKASENAWVQRESKRLGSASNCSISSILTNKGY